MTVVRSTLCRNVNMPVGECMCARVRVFMCTRVCVFMCVCVCVCVSLTHARTHPPGCVWPHVAFCLSKTWRGSPWPSPSLSTPRGGPVLVPYSGRVVWFRGEWGGETTVLAPTTVASHACLVSISRKRPLCPPSTGCWSVIPTLQVTTCMWELGHTDPYLTLCTALTCGRIRRLWAVALHEGVKVEAPTQVFEMGQPFFQCGFAQLL